MLLERESSSRISTVLYWDVCITSNIYIYLYIYIYIYIYTNIYTYSSVDVNNVTELLPSNGTEVGTDQFCTINQVMDAWQFYIRFALHAYFNVLQATDISPSPTSFNLPTHLRDNHEIRYGWSTFTVVGEFHFYAYRCFITYILK
jgi:hypothetical protein